MTRTPMKRRPRKPRTGKDDRKYLAWIRRQPCIVTGLTVAYRLPHFAGEEPAYFKTMTGYVGETIEAVEAHHVRLMAGMGQKPPDRMAVPLLASIHRKMQGRDKYWMQEYGIDIMAKIEELHRRYAEEMERAA